MCLVDIVPPKILERGFTAVYIIAVVVARQGFQLAGEMGQSQG